MRTKKKVVNGWAVVQKKDSFEYKIGDIVEVGLFRRILMMHLNTKYKKVVPCLITLLPKKSLKAKGDKK